MFVAAFRRSLALTVDVFTSGNRTGPWRALLLFVACVVFSSALSSFLLLYLFFSLDHGLEVSAGIAGSFGTVFAVALFLSKRVRCFGTLFFISVFMKKSRNLLLTAGTSLVVLRNVRNTLENLTGLSQSLVCNLQAKREAITALFSRYVEMLRWIGAVLKGVTDLGVVNLDPKLKVTPKVESETLREHLAQAEQTLNHTLRFIHTVTATASTVCSRAFPALSLLILLAFIGLQLRRFRGDPGYKNKLITGRFVEYDAKRRAAGEAHVLPLRPEEAELYGGVRARPSAADLRATLRFCAPMASHCLTWALFITVDALLYLLVDAVTRTLAHVGPLPVPLVISVKTVASLVGVPLSEYSQLKDFSYSVTLFEQRCLPKPRLLLLSSVAPLAFLLVLLLLMALAAGRLSLLRLLVCERFFRRAAQLRVEHLHKHILKKRRKRRRQEDRGATGHFLKLHFWFPLLFKPDEDRLSGSGGHP